MSLLSVFGINNQQIIVTKVSPLGDNLIGATLSDNRKVYIGKKTADEPSNFLPAVNNTVPCAPHMEVRNIKGNLWLVDSRKASALPQF